MEAPALRRVARRRRVLFFTLTFLTSLFATGLMYDILRANGFTGLEKAGLALFFILFTWITGAFWTAFIGFVIQLRGRDRAAISAAEVVGRPLAGRTAVVMPIYNEDTERVAAGLDVIWSSLSAEPLESHFDLFILSDTRKPEIGVAEEAAWRALVARHNAQGRIFYRRRAENVGRKAGNIADFVRTWGGGYDYAIVLDADSIMSGNALVTLSRLMDAHPEAGIIQALPIPTGRETLFARLIQFAARLNSPMLSSGLAYWQLGEGNYWGHNAILRLRPFADFCDLPRLPGSPPFGGEILSHDFVEAAFMRRAGFQVWLVGDVGGSWEEVPSNAIDYAGRDKRWAQGNLQHLGLLTMRGLHWLSRLHLTTGVLSYVTSPIWLTVLVLSTIVVCTDELNGFQYFEPGSYTLFPIWPQYRDNEIVALLSITIGVLLMPKVLGMLLALVKPTLRRGFGGTGKLLISVLVEQLFSMLLAPAMMLFHSAFVLSTLAGKPVTWSAQERGDRGIGFPEALTRHVWHVLLGLAWGALILWIAPRYIWWLLPILAGMILSVPLTMLTSLASAGRWMRRRRLLMTPEETDPPSELAELTKRMTPSERGGGVTGDPHAGNAQLEPSSSSPAEVAEGKHAARVAVEPDTAPGLTAAIGGDIRGVQLPVPVPLKMEAVAPVYFRARDALTGLQRRGSATRPVS
ncbi:MAG TPA: glucans biosynthesis glucosyltransferase MdoH [Steroidobacteraceae bacterium]|nr:glucans biosynthesis glucosyltransferase MdoH [Steroidobacteraceae bacterium]